MNGVIEKSKMPRKRAGKQCHRSDWIIHVQIPADIEPALRGYFNMFSWGHRTAGVTTLIRVGLAALGYIQSDVAIDELHRNYLIKQGWTPPQEQAELDRAA